MFSFSEIKFWPGAIDFCDKNNANGQYFSSTRGNKKNFRKKNLTGHRLSGLVLGMVKKNLNKKVGCALIAAGLLAASSVQGSGAPEDTATERDSDFRCPIGLRMHHNNHMKEVLATTRPSSSGERIKFFHTAEYSLFGALRDVGTETRMYHILIPHDRQYSGREFSEFEERGLPGYEGYDRGNIGRLIVPAGIVVRNLSNGGVSLFHSDELLGASVSGVLAAFLAKASSRGRAGSDNE